ncbi:MAG: rRNA maturation RNase YbeY [Bacteroidales bacterium]|nr:rRNA maturation RNase YbeY [Bacteroidales bacterium]MCF8457684.1 rRNA maturation RNase YbeY [Bacteroidales bacterium]
MYFHVEDVGLPNLDYKKAEKWLISVVTTEKKFCGNLNFIFCSDQHILEINKQYLNHDYFTDIITFDYSEGETVSGDVFISVERVGENANLFGVEFLNELKRVCVHGVLHLIGYKDITTKEKVLMTSKENEYLLMFPQAI